MLRLYCPPCHSTWLVALCNKQAFEECTLPSLSHRNSQCLNIWNPRVYHAWTSSEVAKNASADWKTGRFSLPWHCEEKEKENCLWSVLKPFIALIRAPITLRQG